MKLLVLLALVVVAAAYSKNHYDTKYDNFEMTELIQSKRLLKSYALCFIGKDNPKCTPEGNDIKGWIDEGCATACEKCTPKQKVLVAKFIKALQEQCPEEWEVLRKRGDPEGTREEDLNQFLAQYAS